MKLTAKYKNGTLLLEHPISPTSETVHIEIPDEELRSGDDVEVERSNHYSELVDWQKKVQELLKTPASELPTDDLTDEQRGRWEAFELRSEYRRLHGRAD